MSDQDVRLVLARIHLSRLRALRQQREGGHTIDVLFVAHHDALSEKLRILLSFEAGSLTSATPETREDADVVIECEYSAWSDYSYGALSLAEGAEIGRFKLSGPQERIDAAVEELDSEETKAALEATDRERLTVRLGLLKSGRIRRAIMHPDALLETRLPEAVEEQLRLMYTEWAERTKTGRFV